MNQCIWKPNFLQAFAGSFQSFGIAINAPEKPRRANGFQERNTVPCASDGAIEDLIAWLEGEAQEHFFTHNRVMGKGTCSLVRFFFH